MKTSKKSLGTLAATITTFLSVARGFSQSSFQNLDFETANLPVLPNGQFGGLVATSNGIPGWTAFYGVSEALQISHNGYTLGAVNISILGPDWGGFPILQGSYSVVLQSGLVASTVRTPVTIAQTGIVPASALSVQLSATLIAFGDPAQLVISIGGDSVPLFPLSTTANHTVYGGDVSGFAGQIEELRISSLPTAASPYNYFEIDSIQFSDQPIPEPSMFGLLALGAFLLGWRFCRGKC